MFSAFYRAMRASVMISQAGGDIFVNMPGPIEPGHSTCSDLLNNLPEVELATSSMSS